MPFNLRNLEPDPTKATDGVQFALGADAWIVIAPLDGPKYRKAWEVVTKPYRKLLRLGKLPESQIRDLENRAMAYAVILDWYNLWVDDIDVGEYTVQRAYKLLTEMPGFRWEVRRQASDWSNYR